MDLPAHHRPFAELYRRRGDWITTAPPDALKSHALADPGRVALVDRKGALTYGELDAIVRRAAAGFLALGLRPGDRVALQLPNWREFVVAQQAALRIGAAYVPLLPQLRRADLLQVLTDSRAKLLVTPAVFKGFDHAALARAMRREAADLEHILIAEGGAGEESFDAFLQTPWEERHGAALDAIAVDPDALRVILFTSGTESKPKGVLHSFNTEYFGLKRHVDYFGLTRDEVVMTVSPVGHGTGAVNGVEFGLHLGGKVVLLEAWDPQAGLETMARERATMMWGATTFYSDLVKAADNTGLNLSAFRLAFTAGAPVPRGLVGEVRRVLGAALVTAYGQSEGQNIAITRLNDPPEKISSSDGRFHQGVDWKLVDPDRNPAPRGGEGEIAYRGPNVCLGYLDPAHTAAAFDAEGFVYSGDLGVVDAEGCLRIVGRRKDIIIRGGENISPAEVEDLLFGHPAVAKVSVVGYADARLGQRACAVVVPAPGAAPTLQDLIDYLAAKQVAKFKYPEKIALVDALPTTASGKVRKDVLRAQLFGAG